MIKDEFIGKLDGIQKGSEWIEQSFPGKFTDYEKATLVMRIMTHSHLQEIADQLSDAAGDSIANNIGYLVEAVEKL